METKPRQDFSALTRLVEALASLSGSSTESDSLDLRSIAVRLCEEVGRSTGVSFVYARLHGPAGSSAEAVYGSSATDTNVGSGMPVAARETFRRLADLGGTIDDVFIIPDPFGNESLRGVAVPVGIDGDCGCILAGSDRTNFPADADKLFLTVAANQAAVVLQHQTAEQKLQESEQRFARFMQNLPGLAWIKDANGRYVYANHFAQKAFRMSSAELYGKTDDEVFPPETAARFRENDRLALSRPSGIQLIESLMHDDGVLHHSVVSKFPMPGADGNSVLIGGVAFDITDRIQAEKAALEASRQKDAFFAVLGHELRNPLSPMLTSLQVMRLRGIEGREIEILERQVTHMRRLVDDLLDVSRITSGKVQLQLDDVDVGAILVRTLDTIGPLLAQRHHQLHVKIPKGAIGVRADPERLTQVVTNLLVNASKFSDEGSNIYLEASVNDGFVILSIRDEGIGIAPEMLDTIFDNFVQRPESVDRSRDGLGLGLAVVRSLVRQHGGRVYARSEGRGKGSEFVVELPAVTLLESSLVAPTPVRPRRAVEHRERVLVVDDNRDAAETLHAGLAHYGFEVQVAFEPTAALKLAREFRPSVALLDVGMPEMSGYELAPRLRALVEPGETLRLVAVTGFGQPDDRERAYASGFDRHLVKPVDLKTLLRTLDELRDT